MAVDGQRFMTKTQHYRKVTKPLLERKRRARMNLYLDELKDLIVDTMEAQGEHVAKLEKADILEMTVNYLKTHKHEIAATVQSSEALPKGLNLEKFRAGYTQAAYEVSKIFATMPGLDLKFGTRLMKHLGYQLKDMQAPAAETATATDLCVKDMNNVNYAMPSMKPSTNDYHQFKIENKTGRENNSAEAANQVPEERIDDVWRPW